jgi:hypothetical protein
MRATAREHTQDASAGLEHLATLGLPIARRTVLEVGTGIGDLASVFSRGCSVLATEGRRENYELLRRRDHWIGTRLLDVERPDPQFDEQVEIVFCYGLLSITSKTRPRRWTPRRACTSLLLLETVVAYVDDERLEYVDEPALPSQALTGQGCRPTRRWIHHRLAELFRYVYVPVTRPWRLEFPTDWETPPAADTLARAIFIASRERLDNPLLTTELPRRQRWD